MEQGKKTRDSRRFGERFGSVILIVVFFAGICILLYPSVSDWWNKKVSSRAVFSYDEAISQLSTKDYTEIFEKAQAWNDRLAKMGTEQVLLLDGEPEGYRDILDVTGTGIMGYVTIDKIDVLLPIYHGTSESVLSAGAGHIDWTSFPIGGEGTHSAISAHRGLPSARLFTDLDRLEIGDIFTITVLDQVLTYEVDQILIVTPYELENLYIEDGQDYCTLVTCTPYGINSQRMLVRGTRIANEETARTVRVTSDAIRIEPVVVAPLVAVPILMVLLILLLITTRKK